MRLVVNVLTIALCAVVAGCTTAPREPEKVITFDGVPSPSIAVRQWPAAEGGAFALRIVLYETPEGIASSLVMEPEGNRFAQQRIGRLRVHQWTFAPSECPAMAALYAEFPNVGEAPPRDPPPCGHAVGAVSELRIALGGKVEQLRTPDKYGPWLQRVWTEIDACRQKRAPVTL